MVNFAVIGLGNPGPNYRNTRHNLGFWMLDALAEENRLQFKENKNYHVHYTIMAHGDKKILLVKPTTFMNESGNYLSSLLSYFNCSTYLYIKQYMKSYFSQLQNKCIVVNFVKFIEN